MWYNYTLHILLEGGYVCLGLRFLEMLIQDYNKDHTKVQMNYDIPHSDIMKNYIDKINDHDPYNDPAAVEQILNRKTQKPFVDGRVCRTGFNKCFLYLSIDYTLYIILQHIQC